MLLPPSLAKLLAPVSFPAFRCLCYRFKKKKEEKENDTGTDTARVFELSGGKGELCWWFFGVSQASWVREEVYEVGDLALEGEILEFMKESKNLEAFPSRKELVEPGRMDLVDAIAKKGGWLLLGWDLSEEENEVEQRKVQENVTTWVSGLKLFSMGL